MEAEKKEKKAKQMPPRQITVTIGKNDYEIKLPNQGILVDIEVAKMNVTSGAHKDLILGGVGSREAYLTVEAVCTFEKLIPELSKSLNVKSLFELDMVESKTLYKAYEKYYSWINEWRQIANEE